VQVVHILLDNTGYILKLSQFMTVVLSEHAFGADNLMAEFAEIFYFFLWMSSTVNFG